MKQLVILSGKGGTGKTTVTASFAVLAGFCVLVDADVDAADLHLVVKHEVRESDNFISGKEAVISEELCSSCGICRNLCRFDAITEDLHIDPFSCEGCGVCARACPEEAITMHDSDCGRWFISDSAFGPFVHARLHIAAENSGKMVSLVREKAREEAEQKGIGLILIDGPPGVGCPVIAAVTGCDAALIVTEPTRSGLHDMKRAAELTAHFKIPTFVIINKADLHEETAADIETWCSANGIKTLGRIPFDSAVVEAMTSGKSLIELPEAPAAAALCNIWREMQSETELLNA